MPRSSYLTLASSSASWIVFPCRDSTSVGPLYITLRQSPLDPQGPLAMHHSQLAPLPNDLPFRIVSKTIGQGAYAW